MKRARQLRRHPAILAECWKSTQLVKNMKTSEQAAAEAQETPWDMAKVFYGLDDAEGLLYDFNEEQLPRGWKLSETISTPTHCGVIFEVFGLPTTADGERVAALLKEWELNAATKRNEEEARQAAEDAAEAAEEDGEPSEPSASLPGSLG